MYTREPTSRRTVIKMDPNCAICHGAANGCDCEAKGLDRAVREAEDNAMRPIYSKIRTWVRSHAQDYILEYFHLLTEKRKTAHSAHLDQITAHAYHHYNAPPHPQQLQDAQMALKRGIDADWQASVQRYPEVLEYFYNLVTLTLPAEDEPAVREPTFGALARKQRKQRSGRASVPPPAINSVPYYGTGPISPQTPPPSGRRTPGHGRRTSYNRHHPVNYETAPYYV